MATTKELLILEQDYLLLTLNQVDTVEKEKITTRLKEIQQELKELVEDFTSLPENDFNSFSDNNNNNNSPQLNLLDDEKTMSRYLYVMDNLAAVMERGVREYIQIPQTVQINLLTEKELNVIMNDLDNYFMKKYTMQEKEWITQVYVEYPYLNYTELIHILTRTNTIPAVIVSEDSLCLQSIELDKEETVLSYILQDYKVLHREAKEHTLNFDNFGRVESIQIIMSILYPQLQHLLKKDMNI